MWMSNVLVALVKAVVGASPRWVGCEPSTKQRIYFANHTSHIDAVAIWSALSPTMRAQTRPVAAADYWGVGGVRRDVALNVLNAVLVDRHQKGGVDPLTPLAQALEHGDSLILFPEGTRRMERLPGEFKSGLFHLARRFPQVELVPVYLENLHRIMPKGSFLPVPIVCTVRFGGPIVFSDDENKRDFLSKAKAAVEALA